MSKDSREVVVLSPHVDDEVLGCFSFLGPETHVLCCGAEDRPGIPRAKRLAELDRAAGFLGFSWEVLDHPVNSYSVTELIAPMERVINRFRPTTILLPEPSYNQDHRAVYDAGMVATRPHDLNWLVPTVLLFEQPDSLLWPHQPPFEPVFFREIDLERKLTAYALYASQVRAHRSPATVSAIAALRGAQIRRPFAEAFRVKRLIGPPASCPNSVGGPQ